LWHSVSGGVLAHPLFEPVVNVSSLVEVHVGVIEISSYNDFVVLGVLSRHKLSLHEAKCKYCEKKKYMFHFASKGWFSAYIWMNKSISAFYGAILWFV
jgi:hypothetical protein